MLCVQGSGFAVGLGLRIGTYTGFRGEDWGSGLIGRKPGLCGTLAGLNAGEVREGGTFSVRT